ncbi:MAG: hypothetical protein QM607_09720, partial [Microbacterium sp.]
MELPADETERRKQATNPEWSIAHIVLHRQTRDQGEFNWSSQHLDVRSVDGTTSWMVEGVDRASADDLARASGYAS